jgi:hypothetical protein
MLLPLFDPIRTLRSEVATSLVIDWEVDNTSSIEADLDRRTT